MKRESLFFHGEFRLLWAGDALSQLGTMVTRLALPLMAVTMLHATVFEVGLLATFQNLAFLVIGLPAGAWVDRMRRRTVMITADLVRGVVLGSIPLAAAFGVLTIWQLYAVVLLVGGMTVFFDVSYQSYLPFLVGRERLVEGNSKLQGTQSVAQVAGPGLGGVLVQWLTAPYAILGDAVSYLWSALWVGAIRRIEPAPDRSTKPRLFRDIREGLAFISGQRLLRVIAGSTATANLCLNAGNAMLIVLLARQLALPAGVIGVLMSVGACGGVIGALVARRLADWVGQGPAIWLPLAVASPTLMIRPFLQRDWTLGVFVVCQIAWTAGLVIYNVNQVSFRQRLCPQRLLGRMNATMRFFVWGVTPVGALLGGVLGSTLGVRPTLLLAAAGLTLSFLWIYCSPLRWMREISTSTEETTVPANGNN
jgi:predicted MFS family arabinose efflux permease